MDPAPPRISFILIDDHRAVVDSLAFALAKKKGMACLGKFTSVAEAATAQFPQTPDVGIIDWRFGDGTGAELLAVLRPQLPATKWLLCTATPTPFVIKNALAAGAHGCVAKSCDFDELARAMEALVSGQNYFCQASQMAMMSSLASNYQGLTPTEIAILRLVARGLEPKFIAAELGLAEKTIYNNLGSIRERLRPHIAGGSMVDLARFARQQGIITED